MLKTADDYEAALEEMNFFLDAPKAPKIRSRSAKRFSYLIDAVEEYEQALAPQATNEDIHP